MPPLAPPRGEKTCWSGWQGQGRDDTAAAAWGQRHRSASFHGRAGGGGEEQRRLLPRQRPKTYPDLLGAAGIRAAAGSSSRPAGSPTPSKVLVSVSVRGSMWPLHVMASADWRVSDLVAAAVGVYVKEARRPPLPSDEPAAFGLHYSQFSLESLDPSERVMELGSRSFFLCPKSSALGLAAASPPSSIGTDGATTVSVSEASGKKAPAWLRYMQFWPIM